jgi:energy-coupling factor transport system permease protein
MRKLTYHAGSTIPHRLYPITKLAWLLVISILVFILRSGLLLILSAAALLLILVLIQPCIWKVRGFRFVLVTGTLLFVLYILLIKDGQMLISPRFDFLKVTTVGLEMGLRYSGRFFTVVFASFIFILTTNPSQLAYALMRLGIPYRFGFMLVTALRLAPILDEEGRTIYQAQLVRGVQYDRAGPGKILLLAQQFLTPLLISSLRRADRLFFSMEGRGFGRFSQRTFREKSQPERIDLFCSIIMILIFAIIIFMDRGGLISL